jgi:hypothetical protein
MIQLRKQRTKKSGNLILSESRPSTTSNPTAPRTTIQPHPIHIACNYANANDAIPIKTPKIRKR